MAKCEKIIPEQAPPPPVYRLELDVAEAAMLSQLLGYHVAGMGCSPLLRVHRALKTAGVESGSHKIVPRNQFGIADAVLLVDHAPSWSAK